jgi:hypothetical protein
MCRRPQCQVEARKSVLLFTCAHVYEVTLVVQMRVPVDLYLGKDNYYRTDP